MPIPASAPSAWLPTSRTRLIGREAERADTRTYLLEKAVPLLTLGGPGGVGKTRLALAIAKEVAHAFADGVVWVDLAPVADGDQVPAALAAALQIAAPLEDSLPLPIATYLKTKQVLLLFDNCEHVLAAVADLVATLLTHCPAVQVLATSRAPLQLLGEQCLPVEPLPLPTENIGIAAGAQCAAIQLFVERAQAVRPTFHLNESNVLAIALLCRALDGLPLAIELAAARSTMFSPEALLARMSNRLDLLAHGARNLPARQQTIAATIAWSYDLLDPRAQALFRRLAVFVGGFPLEAALAIASPMDDDSHDVTTIVERLVAQSLVRRLDGAGEPRFAMLETIREFGQERLKASGEHEAARDAHAAFFIAYTDIRDSPSLVAQGARAHRIRVERDNIRAALTHLVNQEDADSVLQLAVASAWYLAVQSSPGEGQQWLTWALTRSSNEVSVLRGLAFIELAACIWAQGDYARAQELAEAALAIAEHLKDRRVAAGALDTLGLLAMAQLEFARARPFMIDALHHWRLLGDHWQEAHALQILAGIEQRLGHINHAERLATDALTLFREIGIAEGIAAGLNRIGALARARDDDHAAAAAHADALRLCVSAGERFHLVWALIGVSEIASRRGYQELAATLVGVVDARVHAAGGKHPLVGELFELTVVTAQAALGEERLTELRAHGERLRFDDVVTLVDAFDLDSRSTSPMPMAVPLEQHRPIPGSDLTFRERDVLALLCQRLTNAEIADRLCISPRTAGTHVANILGKLGAANRREAAWLAVQHGLV